MTMNTLRTLTVLSLLWLASSLTWAQTTDPARLGVNTTTPEHTLDVNGAINIAPDSAYQINGTPVLRTQVVNGFTNLYLGPGVGQSNTTGNRNHFSGFQAGLNNTTGRANHFIGYQAGFSNTTGTANHFSGHRAGRNNTTGVQNHFSGFEAGEANTTGEINYFSGFRAGEANTTGNQNHFSGYQAGRANTAGTANHFSGLQAGRSNTTGSRNHFSGYQAGNRNTTGVQNHFSGLQAGFNNTTGNNNHFSGYQAGLNNTTGRENVYLGYRAGVVGNFTNAIAIGANVNARGNNSVTIGNSSMTSIGGAVGWSQVSDGRFKREVVEDVPGLEFVTRLRPVSYQVDRAALQAFLKGEAVENGKTAQEQPRETGFIAQEVEEVANTLGYTFNGIIQPQSENDHYQLSYATFVVPLVQAVQEQQELIEALQAENGHLRAKVDRLEQLESRLQALESERLPYTTEAVSQRQP